jgi:hypothetical protein
MSSTSLIPQSTQDVSAAVLAQKLAIVGRAVVNIAVAARITHGPMPLSGTQLLQLASNVTGWIHRDRGDGSRFPRGPRAV